MNAYWLPPVTISMIDISGSESGIRVVLLLHFIYQAS
uniref:Uncharacterized protein n=1 Tax=Ciona intestinalis TaxID=7719 RepID=F6SW11_CIOIN